MRNINTRAVVRLCLSLLLLSVPGLAAAESIELVPEHGVFMVPVRINDTITIPFVLDSGAGDVSVPEDVFKTLLRTRTVTESDFREPGMYVTADGSKHLARRFILHEVRVGDHVVKDVVASVAPDKADPLLGQSFLGSLPGWAIDNTRHALVIGAGSEGERPQAAIPVPPQPTVGPDPQRYFTPPDSQFGSGWERGAPAPGIAPAPTKTAPSRNDESDAYRRGDHATSLRILYSLADQGNAAAQVDLGTAYNEGRDVAQDYAEAARWFRKAANQGNANAQNYLGVLYNEGRGVAQDYAEAARWFRKAAEQDYAAAQNDLGVLYALGRGVAQDYAEAARWFRKAGNQGNANAQNNLGILYNEGRGVYRPSVGAPR